MRQVYGINVKGCYFSDIFETSYQYPIREPYMDSQLFAAEAFTEDGTMPCKIRYRVLCNKDYLFWHRQKQVPIDSIA